MFGRMRWQSRSKMDSKNARLTALVLHLDYYFKAWYGSPCLFVIMRCTIPRRGLNSRAFWRSWMSATLELEAFQDSDYCPKRLAFPEAQMNCLHLNPSHSNFYDAWRPITTSIKVLKWWIRPTSTTSRFFLSASLSEESEPFFSIRN